jgi:hypothetical protein
VSYRSQAVALFDRRKRSSFGGIQLLGNTAFRARTLEALQLLSSCADFAVVEHHLVLIKQGVRSGMKAWTKPPAFIVGTATWQHSTVWYAGVLAHEAYHSKLYHDAKARCGRSEPPAETWTGAEAEKKCLVFQRRVLIALGADSTVIAYIEKQLENPTYQGRNTRWAAWLDYLKRWW